MTDIAHNSMSLKKLRMMDGPPATGLVVQPREGEGVAGLAQQFSYNIL